MSNKNDSDIRPVSREDSHVTRLDSTRPNYVEAKEGKGIRVTQIRGIEGLTAEQILDIPPAKAEELGITRIQEHLRKVMKQQERERANRTPVEKARKGGLSVSSDATLPPIKQQQVVEGRDPL